MEPETFEFSPELYVIRYQDGENHFPSASEDLQNLDIEAAAEGRVAVYKLVREGTVKRRPSTIRFTPKKD